MDVDTVRTNAFNAVALSVQYMPVEKTIAILVGISALIYNCLKIYSWLKSNGKL